MGIPGVIIAGLVVFIAVFLMADADLPLIFLKLPEKSAFHNKVVWVTGASSGLGAQMAKDFGRHGAQVILSARRVEQLEAVKRDILATASDVPEPFVLALDVTDLEAQYTAVKSVIERFGNIDIMVLNAGQSQRLLAEDLQFDRFQDLMHLNFASVVHLSQLVLPYMKEETQGQVSSMNSSMIRDVLVLYIVLSVYVISGVVVGHYELGIGQVWNTNCFHI